MGKLKTIDGKDFQKSFYTNMSRVAFCSRELKCEANFTTIKNELGLSNEIMKRLEKLKEKSEKKGSGIVSSYLVDLEEGEIKFDDNTLDNMELLIDVWDDYYALNKTHNILIKECIDLLEKDENTYESKKVGFFFNMFNKKFKKDIENVEVNKMKKIDEETSKKVSTEAHKIKKFIVGIGEDSEGNTLFSFLRCSTYHLLELREEIKHKKEEDYKERIDTLLDFIEYWDTI